MNDPLRARVAANLKTQREVQGLSISELSRISGVAKATLSALESGTANPTLDTLWALTTALHVSLGELVEPREPALTIVRAAEGTVVKGVSVTARLLQVVEIGAARIELYDCSVKKRRQISPAHDRGVSEHLFVTSGHLLVGSEESPQRLRAGDFLQMAPAWPHVYEGLERDTRFFLMMRYPRGG